MGIITFFWAFLILVIYVYFGYPFLLWLISVVASRKEFQIKGYCPRVSIIVAAFNEVAVIREKIENILASGYPLDKMQIIISSDASDDGTDDIVKEYVVQGVLLYRQNQRFGKSQMLNEVVKNVAMGEILIFTDATTLFEKNAISKIVTHFSDENVGAAAARLIFKNFKDNAVSNNHGLYWSYETFLRRKEGNIGVLPFVSGAFYAIRKKFYVTVKDGLPDDSVSPLNVLKNKKKVVFSGEAIGYEKSAETASYEYKIKVRGIVRELASIWDVKMLLNPVQYPLISFILVSHRLLRWSVLFFLVGMYVATICLLDHKLFYLMFWGQNIFYLLALSGIVLGSKNYFSKIVGIPFYFCLLNFSAAVGIIKFIFGARQAVWDPVR